MASRSAALVLAALLSAGAAGAEPLPDDRPLVEVKSGLFSADHGNTQYEVEGGFYVAEKGFARLNLHLAAQERLIVSLKAENTELRSEVTIMAAKPAFSWQAVVLIVGGGIALGVTATYFIMR